MLRSFRAALLCAASLLFLASCDRTASTSPDTAPTGGSLAFRLSDSLVAVLAPQADSVRVAVGRSGIVRKEVSAPLGGWIQIDSLPVGTWDLQVDLYQAGGWISWSGKATVQVIGGRTVDAEVHLARATGNVHVLVVLDSVPTCSTVVVPRVDVVHVAVEGIVLGSLRQIVSVRSEPDTIRIVVRSAPGSVGVPLVAMVVGKDGVMLSVGDPRQECDSTPRPCPLPDSDGQEIRTVLVPWREVPSCAGLVRVFGNGGSFPIQRPNATCVSVDREYFRWESTGGFAGGGTGEKILLGRYGSLRRVVRDSLGRLDTTGGTVDVETMARVDSILARPDVLGLPGAEDTIGSVVFDGFGESFKAYGPDGSAILDFSSVARICTDSALVAEPSAGGADTAFRMRSSPCPASSGARALEWLVSVLRAANMVDPVSGR